MRLSRLCFIALITSLALLLSAPVFATGTAATMVSVSSSANPSFGKQPVTFTATVSPTICDPTCATPTGSVTFKDGSNTIGTVALNSGVATYTTSSLTVGNHTISASYAGNTTYAASSAQMTASAVALGNPQVISKASPTIAVTSSANPSVTGQTVTFTAAISPSTATGSITFKNGTTTLGTAMLSSGVATYKTSTLAVGGSYSINVSYPGDTYDNPATGSLDGLQQVNQGNTNVSLTSSVNPSVLGQAVKFTAKVTAASPALGTPTGTVTFVDIDNNNTPLATATLSSGLATYSPSAYGVVATHNIGANYSGDAKFNANSASIAQVVTLDNASVTISSATNPSVSGQGVKFTVTVRAVSPATGTPTGTVTLYDGSPTPSASLRPAIAIAVSNVIGSPNQPLTSGVAYITSNALPVGSHTITAVYSGDSKFNSKNGTMSTSQTVKQGSSTISSVKSSQNPSYAGQAVTFTATVAAVSPATGTPTGTVNFFDGTTQNSTTQIGSGILDGTGVATFTTTSLAVASHTITASYGGDTNFTAKTGVAMAGNPQVVKKGSSAMTLTSSQNASNIGQSVTFTATVTAVSPAAGTPSGTVTFLDGTTTLGTGTLDGTGVATLTTSSLNVGNHTITASYGGDTNFTAKTGVAMASNPQVVAATLTMTTSSLPDATVGTPYSQTLAVTGGLQPYSFSITSGSLPDGLTLDSSSGKISGTPTAQNNYGFTAQVQDSMSNTSSQNLSINSVIVPLAITTTSLPPANIGQPYSAQLRTSGGIGAPVTWSVSTGSLPAWATLNQPNGTTPATITGTPGQSDIGSTQFILTASDGTYTPTQQLTLNVINGVNNAELNGRYAFQAAGYDESTGLYYTVTGAFAANGDGTISGGEEDINSFSGPQTVAIAATGNGTGSSYSVGADNRGTLTIVTSQGTQTFAFALRAITAGVATAGRMIGTDAGLVISGELLQQMANPGGATFTGNYAFIASGADGNKKRFTVAGEESLAATAGAGSGGKVNNGLMDANSGGNLNSSVSFSGTFTAPDANGRSVVTITFTIVDNGVSKQMTVNMAQYAVNSTKGFVIRTDSVVGGDSLFAGVALVRSISSFSNSNLNGKSVIYMEGAEQPGSTNCGGQPDCGSDVTVGLLNAGSGNFSVTLQQNHDGNVSTQAPSGSYSVSSTGRVTLTNAGNHPPVFYLIGTNQAVMEGTDSKAEFGFMEPQSATPTISEPWTATFGTVPPADQYSKVQSGVPTFNADASISGTGDDNDPNGSGSSNVSIGGNIKGSETYTIDGTTGQITLTKPGTDSMGNPITVTDMVGYVVSSSKIVMIKEGASSSFCSAGAPAGSICGEQDPTILILQQ